MKRFQGWALLCKAVAAGVLLSGAVDVAAEDGMAAFAARGKKIRQIAVCGDLKRGQEAGPRDAADLQFVEAGKDNAVTACTLLLGRWYEKGQGVAQDTARARALYEAAAATDARGHYELGRMSEAGDPAAARAAYRKGADGRDGQAMLALARMLEEGRGGEPDAAGAADLYRQAVRRGVDEASVRLDELQAKAPVLKPEQVNEDVGYWRRTMSLRLENTLSGRDSPLLAAASPQRDLDVLLELNFRRGKGEADVSVVKGSGDPAFDELAASQVRKARLPTPPYYGLAPKGTFAIRLPVIVPKAEAPAAAASAASSSSAP